MNPVQPTNIPRPEHPREDFKRESFYNLNGTWQFAFDDENKGLQEKWYLERGNFPLEITVPFCYQSKASGIGPTDSIHPILWYKKIFEIPEEMKNKRILLHFGAVDFSCRVYINGALLGTHVGGYTPFSFDITGLLKKERNEICLRVEDYPDCTQPRGKQYWKTGLMGCWYTPVSGIWQTVYLEAVGSYSIKYIHITPDIDNNMFTAEIALNEAPTTELSLDLEVSYKGKRKKKFQINLEDRITRIPVNLIVKGDLEPIYIWGIGQPHLYDVKVTISREKEIFDTVYTYFGMRKIEVRDGRIYLNNQLLYQRLILDQGYWPDSLLTPPSDDAIQLDLQYTLDFGYNGARKHQKIEDPRYYYWADKMGVLVWGELPSPYDFTDDTIQNLSNTLQAFISRDFNHPCIITWVPLNESWGVPHIYTDARQQATGRMLYHLCKAADGSRLCSSNDGWEQVKTDICALHDYTADGAILRQHFADRKTVEQHVCDIRPCYVNSEIPTGKEAFLLTEYGGIAFQNIGPQGEMGGMQTWGYHDKVKDEEAFFARFASLTKAIYDIEYCQGFCYTQLTDVMQEINGLLTPDRKAKIDCKRFASINKNQ